MNAGQLVAKRRKRGRIIYMTDKDAAAFERLLKDSFPNIEFAVVREREQRVDRFSSLMDAIEYSRRSGQYVTRVYGWIAPPKWRPRWQVQFPSAPRLGKEIGNLPPGWFLFDGSDGFRPIRRECNVPVFTLHPDGALLQACYDVNDAEVRRFIDKVFRLLTKVTVNRFARVIPDTGEIVDRLEHDMFWAGHDALEICRQRRDHYIWFAGTDSQDRDTYLKPYDWSPARRDDPQVG